MVDVGVSRRASTLVRLEMPEAGHPGDALTMKQQGAVLCAVLCAVPLRTIPPAIQGLDQM